MPAPPQPVATRRGAVVITGASSGIGEACALHLDAAGWTVFAGVRRDQDARALRAKASATLETVIVDVTDGASVGRAARTVLDAVGDRGVAGLVNNAGIAVPGALELLDLDQLRRQLEVNVVGQIAVTQAFLGALRQARGRVVNIGSIAGRVALPFLGPYSASKAALAALTDSLRLELRPWGIEVSMVEAGSVASGIWAKSDAAADAVERAASAEALERYGDAARAMRATMAKRAEEAIPAARVARVVEHALAAKRPRTRYLVGRDARAQAFLEWLLPDRVLDRLLARRIGLPVSPASSPRPRG